MKKKRIFYEKIDSFGVFPDGRIKLDVIFRSEDGEKLIWTPPWKAMIDLVAAAKHIEETNKLKSPWIENLNKSYEKLKEMSDLSRKINVVAGEIAGMLGNLFGDKRIDRIFPHIQDEISGKSKSEQIYYILSQAPTLEEFKIRLQVIINVHQKYFTESEFKRNFNLVLDKISLEIDDNLNVREKEKQEKQIGTTEIEL